MHKRKFQSVVILLRATVFVHFIDCIGPRCLLVAFSQGRSPCFCIAVFHQGDPAIMERCIPDFSGLSDGDDNLASDRPPGIMQSDSDFEDCVEERWQGAQLMSFDSDLSDGEQLQLQQAIPPAPDVEQVQLRRRGRRGRPPGQRGQGRHQREDETPAEKRQRISQARRAAVQQRWVKRDSAAPSTSSSAAVVAVVPAALDPSKWIVIPTLEQQPGIQEPSFLKLITDKPERPSIVASEESESQSDDEIHTWNVLTKKGNTRDSALPSRRTARRRLHSFAGSARILQSTRTSMTLAAYDRHLRDLHGDTHVQSLVSVLSVQHDESSFKMHIENKEGEMDTAIAKVLQIRVSLTCVWELQVGGMVQHVRATTDPMLAHALIERNTADCIKQALDEHVSLPAWMRESFATNVRCTLDDSHAANIKTQAAYVRDASRSGSLDNICIRGPCDSHFAFGILKRVLACVGFDVSGMVNFGLSLNYGGAMIDFRNAVRSIIRERVRLFRGNPPANVTLHNRRVIDSFMRFHTEDFKQSRCMTRRRVLQIRIAVRKLFTGNLRREDVIEHYCRCVPPCTSSEHTAERMDRCVVTPLLRRVGTLDRKSWAGVGDIVQWHCFWQSLHGIGRLAFFRAFGEGQPAGGRGDRQVVVAPGDISGAEVVPAANADAEDDKAEAQRKEKQTALNITRSWLRSNSLPNLTLLSVVCSAVQVVTKKIHSVSTKGFITQQAAKEAKGEPRDFRAKVAANGNITKQSRQKLEHMLLNEHAWSALPMTMMHNQGVASLAGRMILIALASQYMLLDVRYRWYPYIIVFLLTGGQLAEAAAEKLLEDARCRPCTMDLWSISLARRFPTKELLLSPRCLAEVYTVMAMMQISNVVVERGFAIARRIALANPQSRKVNFDEFSSLRVLKSVADGLDTPWAAAAKFVASSKETGTVRRVAGGACRAFWTRHRHNPWLLDAEGKFDWKAATAAYKALDPDSEEKRACIELGELAKSVGRVQRRQALAGAALAHKSPFAVIADASKSSLVLSSTLSVEEELQVCAVQHQCGVHDLGMNEMEELVNLRVTSGTGTLEQEMQVAATMARVVEQAHAKEVAAVSRDVAARCSIITNEGTLQIPHNCFMVQLPATLAVPVTTVRVVDFVRDHAIAAATHPRFAKLREGFEKHWATVNTFKKEQPGYVGDVAASFYQTICRKFGCGLCLCQGRGVSVNEVRVRLTRFVAFTCRQTKKQNNPVYNWCKEGRLALQFRVQPVDGHEGVSQSLTYLICFSSFRPAQLGLTSLTCGTFSLGFTEASASSASICADVEFINTLPLETSTVSVSLLMLADTQMPIAAFRPSAHFSFGVASDTRPIFSGPGSFRFVAGRARGEEDR